MKKTTILTIGVGLAAALLLGGCSTADSPTAPTRAALDTAPPAVPTGLNAAAGRSAVKLSWQPNTTDPDWAGYHVYRLAFGSTWPLTSEPVTETRFLDRAPLAGYATYAVTSVDALGNESAWTQIRFNYAPTATAISDR